MMKTVWLVVMMGMFGLMGTNVLACSAAGPGKHVGVVLSMEAQGFTLKDAETGQALHFQADARLLAHVADAGKHHITVRYHEASGKLVAEGLVH